MSTTTELVPASSGAQLAGLFDPRVDGALTTEERDLISVLISRDDSIDAAIPEDITDEGLWDALQVCCKVESRVRKVQAVLKMLVGRALVLMQARPAMYRDRGFKSLDELISNDDRGLPATTGISRSELYNAKKIAESFPTISMSRYKTLGFNKLLVLSKVTNEKKSDSDKWLDKADGQTLDKLKVDIYKSGNGIEPGDLELPDADDDGRTEPDPELCGPAGCQYQRDHEARGPGVRLRLRQLPAGMVFKWRPGC